jgi:hypothetical protein
MTRIALPAWLVVAATAVAQKAPDAGYALPAGGRAGSTVEVRLGGYDWTPDLDVHFSDPRVKVERLGPPGPVLVTPPPYWFGARGTLAPHPMPREMPVRITLPADLSPGHLRWRVANASGGGPRTGLFAVGTLPEVTEAPTGKEPQALPELPVTVNGRLSRIEETDRYRFRVKKDGPVTLDLAARRLGSNIRAALLVIGRDGRVAAEAIDTPGRDPRLTFAAKAGEEYTVHVHDFDFDGDWSFVYRLTLTPDEPPPLVPLPAAGPAALPGTVTGILDKRGAEGRHTVSGKKGEVWAIDVRSARLGSPLDVTLAVLGPDGKELARNDDLPGTTDAGVTFTVPADGTYTLVVGDVSGRAGGRDAVYRLSVGPVEIGFTLATVGNVNLPVGLEPPPAPAEVAAATPKGKKPAAKPKPRKGPPTELVVKATRTGGFTGPITLEVTGLPEGVTLEGPAVIAANQAEAKLPLAVSGGAPTGSALVRVTGKAEVAGKPVTRPALAPVQASRAVRDPAEEQSPEVLVAVTLKPRVKVTVLEADGGRKVHAGTTHPAEMTLERLEGYAGPVHLWMAATQAYQRQGIRGPELTVPAGVTTTFYPCFMPEWLETTRASRLIVVAVTPVADPRGRVRQLLHEVPGRITMSIEGPILKLAPLTPEVSAAANKPVSVTVQVRRAAKLSGPVKLELVPPESGTPAFKFDAITLPPGQTEATLTLQPLPGATAGEHTLTLRATGAMGEGLPVVAEAAVLVEVGK